MSKVTILSKPNRIVIASKGVQGPPGPTGDLTPELIAARDAAVAAASEAASSESAAQGYASTASDAASAASQSADAAAASEDTASDKADEAAASADLADQARLLGAAIGFATKADMDASLAHPAGTLALVTNDANRESNGTYRKTGASGSGSWVQSADRVTGLALEMVEYTRSAVGTETVSYSGTGVLPLIGYLSLTTGDLIARANWMASDFIPVKENDRVTLTANTDNALTRGNIAFFDSEHGFISAAAVGPNNVNATSVFSAPSDGFVRVASLMVDGVSFAMDLELLKAPLSDDDASRQFLSVQAGALLAQKGAVLEVLPGAAHSSVEPGYMAANGVPGEAAIRRHRKIEMQAGETAYFGGLSMADTSDPAAIPAVVFVNASGAPSVVKEAPLRTSGWQFYSGKFTASEAGHLYANQMIDPANPGDGYLVADSNGGVLDKERMVGFSDVGDVVVSKSAFDVYDASLNMSGEWVVVTDDVPVVRNEVLYRNRTVQTIVPGGPGYDEWGTAYVPVLSGDVVRLHGVISPFGSGSISYMIQLNERGEHVAELVGMPEETGWQTIEASATHDGFVAVLVRLKIGEDVYDYTISRKSSTPLGDKVASLASGLAAVPTQIQDALDTAVEPIVRTVVGEEFEDIAGETIEQMVAGAIATSDVSGIARVDSVMEKLPVRLSMLHGYNSQTYTQNNIVEGGGYQYIVGVDEQRNPFIMRRSLLGGAWEIFDLSTIPGNPFDAPNQPDSHNNFVMAITKDGHLLISGNQHTSPCRCVVSNNPHDITSWTEVPFTTSGVTYPRFLNHPDGTTLGFWRETDRSYYMAEFDDDLLDWGAKRQVIGLPENPPEGSESLRVYEQTLAIDAVGDLHLCWGYRAFPYAEGNFGMFYAKSSDKGVTFENAAGTLTYSAPLTDVNSERIYTVNAMEGYVNQCGGCYDLDNRYHTVFWHNDPVTGFGRIMHVWFNGTTWRSEAVYHLDRPWPPLGGLLSGEFKRPHIICGQSGRLFVIYANLFQSADQIRAIDVTTEGSPQDFCIIKFGVRLVQLALNIEFPIKNNELVMMLAKGASGGSQVVWDNQGAYLVTVPLPVA